MTYGSGSLILDDDYNIFVNGAATGTGSAANVNNIWGAGTASTYGWGQSGTLAGVSAGATITATQWATLLNRIVTISNHTGTSITTITNPSAGNTIEAYAALSSNISAIYEARLNAAANGSDLTTNGTTTTTSTWSTSAVTTKTITFGSADEKKYFFNAGGHIRMSFSLTGGSDAKSLEWADLLTKTGTIVLACTGSNPSSITIAGVTYTGTTKIGGSGTPDTLATTIGNNQVTGVDQTIFKQFADSSPYLANYIQINVKTTSSTNITFTVSLIDAAAEDTSLDGTGTGDALDIVDGTLTMTTVIRPPSTTYLTSTWGTPTQNAATWTVS